MAFKLKSVISPAPQVARGKALVLKGDPKGKTFVYTFGKTVVVRNIDDPAVAYTYNEHSCDCTVAAYAPSGNYMASGDVHGNVRIWATDTDTHILKFEYRPLAGAIKDICWSDDSKRLVCCGEGKDIFAKAIMWDSGSSLGELVGHSKFVNSVDFKLTRPYRVVTGSEDSDVGFYQGPPFKMDHLNKDHSNFVNAVRFSPDGNFFVSGGADGRAFVYDGKEGKKVAEVGGGASPAHTAGIYAVSWSPDSKRFITASADKTVKMWDVQANSCVTTFTFADDLGHQQLGCLWQGSHILSVSLNGNINYLDESNPSTTKRIVQGHMTTITALAVTDGGNTFYAASADGRLSRVDVGTGLCKLMGQGYGSAVNALQVTPAGLAATCFDDTFSITPLDAAEVSSDRVKLESQPQDLCVEGEVAVVACLNHVQVVRGGKVASTLAVKYEPQTVCQAPGGKVVAIGGKDKSIHIYEVQGTDLKEIKVLEASGSVECVSYSPCGNFLASGDGGRNVYVYDVAKDYERKMDRWKFHSSKVVAMAWTSDSKHLATSSLDTNVIIWNMDQEMKRTTIKAAHPLHDVTKLAWLNDTTLLTAGRDATFRTWEITHV